MSNYKKIQQLKTLISKGVEMQNFIDNGLVLSYHNFERNRTPHSKLVNIFEIDLSKWTQLEHV